MKNTHRIVSRLIRMYMSIGLIFSAVLLINIPMVYSAPPDAEMCDFLERFHGHTCPGSLMGLRLGLAAKDALNAQGRIHAKTFLLACPVDGIQVATGATYGNKAITVDDQKELYLILTDTKSGKKVEARLTEEAMGKGQGFRELSAKSRTLAAGSPEQSAVKKEIDDILNWYRTAPDEKVVAVTILD